MRIILAIATLLIFLGLTFWTTWFIIKSSPVGLDIVCILLTIAFGYLTWHDYNYFFGKK